MPLEFRNAFGEAIIEPEQIRDTCINSAEQAFLAPSDLLDKLQGENKSQAFARQVRVHERVCELDERFGVLDFTIKARSRNSKDIEHAYFQAHNDLTVWTNVRDGNTLLLEYNPDEDNRLQGVTFLRQGLPKFFNLTADAVHAETSKVLPRDQELAYQQYESLA